MVIDCQSCDGLSDSAYGPACWRCVNGLDAEPEPVWLRALLLGLLFGTSGLLMLLVLVNAGRLLIGALT